MSIVEAKDLRTFVNKAPNRKLGCLIDTNILFAANFSLDLFHDKSVEILSTLIDEKIPLYTNVNIRSEFINQARKVVIVHALIDLFREVGTDLPIEIYNKLRSLKTRSDSKETLNLLFKINEEEIEQIRNMFSKYHPTSTLTTFGTGFVKTILRESSRLNGIGLKKILESIFYRFVILRMLIILMPN